MSSDKGHIEPKEVQRMVLLQIHIHLPLHSQIKVNNSFIGFILVSIKGWTGKNLHIPISNGMLKHVPLDKWHPKA